jgi:REP element-mobilizing transposase RayT
MTYDVEQHYRRSIRLRGYDYTHPGVYFVTLCTQKRECLLGEIIEGQMRLNEVGRTVMECWVWLGQQYPYVELDSWVIMPNHLHGIIMIADGPCRGGSRTALTKNEWG